MIEKRHKFCPGVTALHALTKIQGLVCNLAVQLQICEECTQQGAIHRQSVGRKWQSVGRKWRNFPHQYSICELPPIYSRFQQIMRTWILQHRTDGTSINQTINQSINQSYTQILQSYFIFSYYGKNVMFKHVVLHSFGKSKAALIHIM